MMFRSALLVIATLFTYTFAEEVMTLTQSNFDETIKNNPFVLVEFYAPWCGHCKKLAPEYESAAVSLKDYDPKVIIAKVDATVEKDLATKFGIKGFPTLKWFVEGTESEYTGGRTESTIVSWVKKKTGPAAVTVETEEDLEKFKKTADAVVLGIFKDETEAASFLKKALTDDDTPFGVCYGDKCKTVTEKEGLKASTKIVVLQNFEEGKAEFEGDHLDVDEISTFVSANSLPSIIEFSQKSAPKVFGGAIKNHVLIFVDKHSTDESKKIKSDLQEVAKTKKEKVNFLTVQKEDARVMEFFGVKEDELPTIRFVNMDGGAKKYKYTSDEITAKNVDKFVEDYFAGNLKIDLKSEEPIPESEQGNVRVVVGKDFNEVVAQEGKDVLVEFYAPWCGHCKKLEPEYNAVGEHFKDNDNIVIAKVDATANEVESVSVTGFPTLKFFPAGSSEPMDYDGPREKDGMIEWITKNAKSLK